MTSVTQASLHYLRQLGGEQDHEATAELAAGGADLCGQAQGRPDDYDVGVHWVAVVIIFILSLLGAMMPVLAERSYRFLSEGVMTGLFGFGTGVVIATAFIHMILPAMEALEHPCLGLDYPLAMAIVVATILLQQLLEFCLVNIICKLESDGDSTPLSLSPMADAANLGDGVTVSNSLHVVEGDYSVIKDTDFGRKSVEPSLRHSHHQLVGGSSAKSRLRLKVTATIFEIGVYCHSVIIGVALGVTSGTQFSSLFTALAFHQFFEGIALGTTAVRSFKDNATHVTYLMILGFALSTPLGTVIGIGVSNNFSETSAGYLWVKGILDAIAGGVLTYSGLIELLTFQFTASDEFAKMSTMVQACSLACIFLGALCMAIIGYWA